MIKTRSDKNIAICPLLKAIGNPVRLDILHFLSSGEKCVCTIFAHLDLPQNLISHHLGILRKNDVIKAKKDGKWVHYSLRTTCFVKLQNFANDLAKAQKGTPTFRCKK